MTVLGKLVFSVAPKKQQQQQTNKNANIRTNKQTESYITSVIQITRYRAYSLTCPASMQIYENKRELIHARVQYLCNLWERGESVFTHVASIYGNFWELKNFLHKKRVQLPQDLFGTLIWAPWIRSWTAKKARTNHNEKKTINWQRCLRFFY